MCALISLFVLGLLGYTMVRYRRGANPTPSRTSHNTAIEVIWTLVPVLILVGDRDPVDPPAPRRSISPPPADLTVKVIGNQWYWTYQYPDNGGFEIVSNMLKEQDDVKPGERFRTDADGPPLLAVDERHGHPGRQGGEVHRHLQRRHPRLRRPRLLDQDRRQPGPPQRDLGQGRSPGRLFRPVQRAVRRAPRLYADRGRGGVPKRPSTPGSPRRAAHARAPPAPAPTAPAARRSPRPLRPPRPSRERTPAGPAAIEQPATNQAATAQN